MLEIDKIYHKYLLSESKNHAKKYEKYKGWYSASSAGSCFIKQHLKAKGTDEKPMDERTMRVLRLGTIVHSDVEKAVIEESKNIDEKTVKIYSEKRIELPELNVVGHLDIGVHLKEENKLFVYDLKTAHSFKWKKVFGRNIDPNPSVNYQLQLGTYGMGLGLELECENVDLGLIWYKKDDSRMKLQAIDSIWLDNAWEYWVELNETLADKVPTPGSTNAPVYNWECRYCPYKGTDCDGI
jgi:CRISPR/Cas system-associated exonuclease Cas4 (RecB family)